MFCNKHGFQSYSNTWCLVLCNMFLICIINFSSFILARLNILVTFYIALLVLRKVVSIFLSHLFQKSLYAPCSRSDFMYLGLI